jgi:hypothetical protein
VREHGRRGGRAAAQEGDPYQRDPAHERDTVAATEAG